MGARARKLNNMSKRHAFTLVELLVVLAIIGIVASLVVGMIGPVKAKQMEAQVSASKNVILLSIQSYQAKLNFYPPDNGFLVSASPSFPVGSQYNYDGLAATNPLIYELTGATNNYLTPGNFSFFDGTSNITSTMYSNVFNRSAVNNGNPDEPHDFLQSGLNSKSYSAYWTNGGLSLYGLIVPVPYSPTTTTPNFWHYDSSSTNRHNQNSFDLWAEYTLPTRSGVTIITNGNW